MFCVKISAKGGTSSAFDIDSDQGASIEPPTDVLWPASQSRTIFQKIQLLERSVFMHGIHGRRFGQAETFFCSPRNRTAPESRHHGKTLRMLIVCVEALVSAFALKLK